MWPSACPDAKSRDKDPAKWQLPHAQPLCDVASQRGGPAKGQFTQEGGCVSLQ